MERLKKVYYGPTTFQQRQYLMQVYQNTGNVTEACRVAKVSRGTFYRWHPRFKEQGEAGLQDGLSQAPHRPHRVKEELAQRAIEMKQSRPSLGSRSVANCINQEHGYQRVISHETVRRVWKRHSPPCPPSEQQPPQPAQDSSRPVRRSDCPDKTVNIDLCFIPRQKLPQAEPSPAAEELTGEPRTRSGALLPTFSYPGQVFQREDLSYDEQMALYAQGRKEREEAPKPKKDVAPEEAALQKELQELHIQQEELRQEGRKSRKARKEQDQAWRTESQQRKKALQERQKLSRKEKKRLKRLQRQEDEQWKAKKQERQQAVQQPKQEQAQQKERRQELKKKEAELKGSLSVFLACFVAVLVVVDNCTRRCLGLPIFLEGRNVKADSIIEALKVLLPPELQYLI